MSWIFCRRLYFLTKFFRKGKFVDCLVNLLIIIRLILVLVFFVFSYIYKYFFFLFEYCMDIGLKIFIFFLKVIEE